LTASFCPTTLSSPLKRISQSSPAAPLRKSGSLRFYIPDPSPVKCLPRRLIEFTANPFQRDGQNVGVELLQPVAVVSTGELSRPIFSLAGAASLARTGGALAVAGDFPYRDYPKPIAEATALGIIREPANCLEYAGHYGLRHFVGIGILQTSLVTKSKNERRIRVDKQSPGSDIRRRAETHQEARLGRERFSRTALGRGSAQDQWPTEGYRNSKSAARTTG
jgi:hypothetical protein